MNALFSPLDYLAQFAPAVQLAEWASAEVGFGVAVALTFSGMLLHWQLPNRQMTLEERMKDGKVTEEQARRALRIWRVCAPIVTGLGIALLLMAFLRWSR
jgi:hypothetical protein